VHSIDRKSGIVRTRAALKIVATTAAGHLILRLDTAARSRFRRKAKPQRQARGDEQPEANGDHRNQDSHLGPHSLPRRARPLSAFCPNLQRTPPSRIMFIPHERYERISLRALGQAGIIVISPWPPIPTMRRRAVANSVAICSTSERSDPRRQPGRHRDPRKRRNDNTHLAASKAAILISCDTVGFRASGASRRPLGFLSGACRSARPVHGSPWPQGVVTQIDGLANECP
jgi:hypothetical protein